MLCTEYFNRFLSIVVQSCTNETLRLVNGPLESAGRVEICINGVWGTVCSNYPHSNYSRVVCRQLGYNVNTSDGELVSSSTMEKIGGVTTSQMPEYGNELPVTWSCDWLLFEADECSETSIII